MKSNKIAVSEKITAYLSSLYGAEWTEQYCAYSAAGAEEAIRVNTLKTSTAKLSEELLAQYGITCSPVDEVPEALRISDPNGTAGKTIHHITGRYYIQSLSSMMPVLALDPKPGERVLDLCAAPGSKSTFIANRMNNSGVLVTNEVQPSRTGILSYNLERMSIVNAGIINAPGELLSPRFPEYFDKVLVDAPCSGLGIVHKKGEVSNWWNPELAEKLAHLQYRLLLAAAKMVKPGGLILYSTCTLTLEENEMVVNRALQKLPLALEPLQLPIVTEEAFTSRSGEILHDSLSLARRVIPWQNNSEGFFLAKLRKTGSLEFEQKGAHSRKHALRLLKKQERDKLLSFFEEKFGIATESFAPYTIAEKSNDFYILSREWESETFDDFNRAGLKIGSADNYGNVIVHTNFAQLFARHLEARAIPLDDKKDIKTYLEGGTIRGNFPMEKGQAAVSYRGAVLGMGAIANGQLKSRFPRAFRTQAIAY